MLVNCFALVTWEHKKGDTLHSIVTLWLMSPSLHVYTHLPKVKDELSFSHKWQCKMLHSNANRKKPITHVIEDLACQ